MSFWNNSDNDKLGNKTNNKLAGPAGTGRSARPNEANPALLERPNVATSSASLERSSSDSFDSVQRYSNIRSALGPGTIIQGKLSFDTPVRIDGKLSGEVFSSEALIVGSAGSIDAQLKVASLIIMGKVKGSIVATERIELLAGGSLEGEVTTPVLKMDEASFFNGSCTMGAKLGKTALAAKDEKAKADKSAPSAKVESPAHEETAVKSEAGQPEAGLH